jgi:hypothetical protein
MPSQDYEEFIAASGLPGRSRVEIRAPAHKLAERRDAAGLRRLGEPWDLAALSRTCAALDTEDRLVVASDWVVRSPGARGRAVGWDQAGKDDKNHRRGLCRPPG